MNETQSRLNQQQTSTITTRLQIFRPRWILEKIEYGLQYVKKFGKEVCPNFVIDEDNIDVITRLIRYFHGDPAFNPSDSVLGDLRKGILLCGKPGVGKTVLMETFSRYVEYDQMFFRAEGKDCRMHFPITPVNLVVANWESTGNDFLDFYSRRRIICFDDLGEEKKEALHFGSRMNVMQEILERRYNGNVITLATTNHTLGEIGKMYGGRVHSRMIEMFNVMVLPGKDRRKDTVKYADNTQMQDHS